MGRPGVIYLSTMVLFVVAMWGILHVGGKLKAPPDISGQWWIADEAGVSGKQVAFTIRQSGQFVKWIEPNRSEPVTLHMTAVELDEVGERVIRLEGDGLTVVFKSEGGSSASVSETGITTVEMTGSAQRTLRATRTRPQVASNE